MRDIGGAQGHARGSNSSQATYGIFRDAWGIPHLRAADARALAHAQGRVTALDRADFDLYPGEPRTLSISFPATTPLATLRAALRVRSLVDSYA